MKEHPPACSNGRFGAGPLASQFDASERREWGKQEDESRASADWVMTLKETKRTRRENTCNHCFGNHRWIYRHKRNRL